MTCCDWPVKELHPCRGDSNIGHWVSGPWPEWANARCHCRWHCSCAVTTRKQVWAEWHFFPTALAVETWVICPVSRSLPSKLFMDSQKWYLSVMIPIFPDAPGPSAFWGCCFGKDQVRALGRQWSLVRAVTPCSNLKARTVHPTTTAWSGDKRPWKGSLLLGVENIESNEVGSWL